jgi:hypothetical protein
MILKSILPVSLALLTYDKDTWKSNGLYMHTWEGRCVWELWGALIGFHREVKIRSSGSPAASHTLFHFSVKTLHCRQDGYDILLICRMRKPRTNPSHPTAKFTSVTQLLRVLLGRPSCTSHNWPALVGSSASRIQCFLHRHPGSCHAQWRAPVTLYRDVWWRDLPGARCPPGSHTLGTLLRKGSGSRPLGKSRRPHPKRLTGLKPRSPHARGRPVAKWRQRAGRVRGHGGVREGGRAPRRRQRRRVRRWRQRPKGWWLRERSAASGRGVRAGG